MRNSRRSKRMGRKSGMTSRSFLEQAQMHVATRQQLRAAKRAGRRVFEEEDIPVGAVEVTCPACGGTASEIDDGVFVCDSCDNSFELINTDFVEALEGSSDEDVVVAIVTTDETGDIDAVVVELDPEVEVEDVIDAVDEIETADGEGAIENVVAAEPDEGDVGVDFVEDGMDDTELGESRRRRPGRRPGRRPAARRGRRPSRR